MNFIVNAIVVTFIVNVCPGDLLHLQCYMASRRHLRTPTLVKSRAWSCSLALSHGLVLHGGLAMVCSAILFLKL